ncbi:uncharacterized protein PHALS_07296 [Plasmopara halstedii]|uniref:Uncharacterized protein n=1 Tax=Plasmopara halstedii TaxID=4781 RepID=A0A0P1B6L2_PLAHL|nr:uncharacterized protein PHALS_07296 [Plasmopara halstedii]CEG49538.1 hypothetical protein PHALS_07296 [Plasmopara halstedii]|eukprot:XP_024585907.1 hypothetical protein PHALS_07296 [Plasmopara halstedii]
MEKAYEDELIDAFDATEPNALMRAEDSLVLPQSRKFTFGQMVHPNDISSPYPTLNKTIGTQRQIDKRQHDPLQVDQDDLMTEEEMQRNRERIDRDVRTYQQRFDHVAQALARETPHQLQERRMRKEERLKKQEQRYEDMRRRLQRDVDRLEEREKRQARIMRRHHVSRSTSPSGDNEGHSSIVNDI